MGASSWLKSIKTLNSSSSSRKHLVVHRSFWNHQKRAFLHYKPIKKIQRISHRSIMFLFVPLNYTHHKWGGRDLYIWKAKTRRGRTIGEEASARHCLQQGCQTTDLWFDAALRSSWSRTNYDQDLHVVSSVSCSLISMSDQSSDIELLATMFNCIISCFMLPLLAARNVFYMKWVGHPCLGHLLISQNNRYWWLHIKKSMWKMRNLLIKNVQKVCG